MTDSKGAGNKLLTPVCFFIGHEIIPAEDKPGWYKSDCGRCGLDVHHRYFRRIRSIPYKVERSLVWAVIVTVMLLAMMAEIGNRP